MLYAFSRHWTLHFEFGSFFLAGDVSHPIFSPSDAQLQELQLPVSFAFTRRNGLYPAECCVTKLGMLGVVFNAFSNLWYFSGYHGFIRSRSRNTGTRQGSLVWYVLPHETLQRIGKAKLVAQMLQQSLYSTPGSTLGIHCVSGSVPTVVVCGSRRNGVHWDSDCAWTPAT